MQYWAFCANPDYYRIVDAVRELEYDNYDTEGKDIQAGDKAIIWKAKGNSDRNGYRGIIALANIVSGPTMQLDMHPEYQLPVPDDTTNPLTAEKVTVQYVGRSSLPLWIGGPEDSLLSGLAVARARGGGVFHVSPEQWEAIIEASRLKDRGQDDIGGNSSSMFVRDAQLRKAIEMHAMRRAIAHYQAEGWSVADVSASQSYDLHCVRGSGEELRVEVKGTTTDGTQIILTRNEITHAREQHPHVVLFITSHIRISLSTPNHPQTSGGDDLILERWYPEDDALSALSYAYAVPRNR